MIVLLTGSRNWDDRARLFRVLDFLWFCVRSQSQEPLFVRHGDHKDGADKFGKLWVDLQRDHRIRQQPDPVTRSEWASLGGRAGNLRNQRMIDRGGVDYCVAFSRDGSNGTADCAERARRAEIPVWMHVYGFPIEPPPTGRLVAPQLWQGWINDVS